MLLDGRNTHHAANVMRVREGDKLELFDGQGLQANAIVQSADRRAVTCQSEPAEMIDRESDCMLELGSLCPKAIAPRNCGATHRAWRPASGAHPLRSNSLGGF